ncbi:MAG: selenocysteine-specific translation elongation factor [bacterium]
MKNIIIGTAGHIDHGKSLLVKALTGVDPDRLKEEKERGITIDLGFAPLVLPGLGEVSIVDVPGHERFIRTMVAGVSGIDLVLFVVAADDGVMPQTREHMDILNLLRIRKGIVVITKVDLVDEEWLGLVKEDVRELVWGTFLEGAPLIAVSSVTGQGIEELRDEIARSVEEEPPRREGAKFRLPIDRSFTIKGFGTIVTGSVLSGRVRVGDSVQILPSGVESRVRGIQVRGKFVPEVGAGQRAALNLLHIEKDSLQRGDVVCHPGVYKVSQRFDARLQLLPDADKPLKNRERVWFLVNTSDILGRIILLDRDALPPGESCFIQFQAESPSVVDFGDRFVIRRYYPLSTIGGGVVMAPMAPKHKRFSKRVLEGLEVLERGNPSDILIDLLSRGDKGFLRVEEASDILNVGREELEKIVAGLPITSIEGKYLVHADTLRKLEGAVVESCRAYHRDHPLRRGISKEQLRASLPIPLERAVFDYILLEELAERGEIVMRGDLIRSADFKITLSPEEQSLKESIESAFLIDPFSPPSPQETIGGSDVAEDIFWLLVDDGTLVKVGDLFFHRRALEKAESRISRILEEKGEFTVSQLRDSIPTSRKYLIPLLEYFDRKGLTRRFGDVRRRA